MNIRQVEETLIAHPNVVEVCVLTLSEFDSGPHYRAFVALRDSHELLIRSFCEWCRHDLQCAEMGVEVHVLSILPRTRMGSVARKHLMAIVEGDATWLASTEVTGANTAAAASSVSLLPVANA